MGQRTSLQSILEDLLGSRNVYFQPPPGLKMLYPAIIYRRDGLDAIFADNWPYKHETRYQVTVVDASPDSDIPMKVAALPKCLFDRFYVADQLNHDVFNLFF